MLDQHAPNHQGAPKAAWAVIAGLDIALALWVLVAIAAHAAFAA